MHKKQQSDTISIQALVNAGTLSHVRRVSLEVNFLSLEVMFIQEENPGFRKNWNCFGWLPRFQRAFYRLIE